MHGEKRCPRCGEAKALELFKIRKRSPDGRSSWCKGCDAAAGREAYASNPQRRREVWARGLERLYGITAKDYEDMFEAQGGCCAICGSPPKNDRRLCVDHDHQTGVMRQLLCTYCNVVVGVLENGTLDDYRAYLERHEGGMLPIQAGGDALLYG